MTRAFEEQNKEFGCSTLIWHLRVPRLQNSIQFQKTDHEGKPTFRGKIPVTVIRRLPENQMEKLLSQV